MAERPTAILASSADAAVAIDALIGNVFSHTPPGTGFGIRARRNGDNVEIEVADSGPGFPQGFDPGQRGASGADSTGLGLDIVERFAGQSGGEMRLLSSHVGGSRVVVELPIVAEAPPASAPTNNV